MSMTMTLRVHTYEDFMASLSDEQRERIHEVETQRLRELMREFPELFSNMYFQIENDTGRAK